MDLFLKKDRHLIVSQIAVFCIACYTILSTLALRYLAVPEILGSMPDP